MTVCWRRLKLRSAAPPGNAGPGGFPQQGGAQAPAARGRTNATSPQAGGGGTPAQGGRGAITIAGENWDVLDPHLVQYLLTNQGDARYLVATTTSTYASIFMLATDQPALALGGYQGWDRIVTPQGLAALVARGEVRFFYLGAATIRNGTAGASSRDATVDLVAWVRANCAVAATEATGATAQGQQLYDCVAAMRGQP